MTNSQLTAQIFTVLLVLGAASSLNFNDVDPNALSCDPAGQVFLLLPHFTDCDKFYMCNHGNEVEFSCAPGTVFDFALQTCNHAWATKCWLREVAVEEDIIIEGSGDEGSGQESGDFEWFNSEDQPEAAPAALETGKVRASRRVAVAKPTLPQSQFAAKLDCKNARQAARSVPFIGDCQRFWRCVDGLPVSAFCSDGLFFNERTMQCDFEANVRCIANHDAELQGEYMIFE